MPVTSRLGDSQQGRSRNLRRAELGAFLRHRRDTASPEDYGIKDARPRRAPGLRREEVADLAGLSLTWYTWLEQGREIGVSRQILESLARVFQLSAVERNYLFSLVGEAPGGEQLSLPREASAEQIRVLDYVRESPAYLTNRRFDVLRANADFRALFPTIAAQPQRRQNLLWSTFMDDGIRQRVVDWEREARLLVAQFRATAEDRLFSSEFSELVSALMKGSAEFREMWKKKCVLPFASAERVYRDEGVGTFTLHYTKLDFAENPEVSLVVQTPDDGSPFWEFMNSKQK
jgi:transcriptional regulator with XRE-family HTH domain